MAKKSGELGTGRTDAGSLSHSEGHDPLVERFGDSSVGAAGSDEFGLEAENLEMTGEHPDETEHLRAQIEETRREMGETIDALQEKLSLSNVQEQVSETVSMAIETAKDSIYEATIGKAVGFMKSAGEGISNSGAMRTVRENPFPVLLIGLGAGLLAYQSYSARGRRLDGGRRMMSGRHNMMADETSESNSLTGEAASYAGRTYEKAASAVGGVLETVSGTATSAYDGVSRKLGSAYMSAGEMATRAAEVAGQYKEKAYETYDHYLEDNPLAVGAVALAVGAAVGFAIPATRFEGRMMGDARENLLNKAQDMAGELVDRAKHVAGEAGRTIQDEAKALTQ
ncbi:MAG: DUF3618 domain-containing protein [Pyrinomonadaceae bacterium]